MSELDQITVARTSVPCTQPSRYSVTLWLAESLSASLSRCCCCCCCYCCYCCCCCCCCCTASASTALAARVRLFDAYARTHFLARLYHLKTILLIDSSFMTGLGYIAADLPFHWTGPIRVPCCMGKGPPLVPMSPQAFIYRSLVTSVSSEISTKVVHIRWYQIDFWIDVVISKRGEKYMGSPFCIRRDTTVDLL